MMSVCECKLYSDMLDTISEEAFRRVFALADARDLPALASVCRATHRRVGTLPNLAEERLAAEFRAADPDAFDAVIPVCGAGETPLRYCLRAMRDRLDGLMLLWRGWGEVRDHGGPVTTGLAYTPRQRRPTTMGLAFSHWQLPPFDGRRPRGGAWHEAVCTWMDLYVLARLARALLRYNNDDVAFARIIRLDRCMQLIADVFCVDRLASVRGPVSVQFTDSSRVGLHCTDDGLTFGMMLHALELAHSEFRPEWDYHLEGVRLDPVTMILHFDFVIFK